LENQAKIPDLVCAKVVEELENRNQLFRNASKDDIRQIIMESVQNALGIRQGPRRERVEPVVTTSHPPLFCMERKKMSRIPPDFKMPVGNLEKAWVHYCCWDDQNNIPPLRAVYGHELKRSLSPSFASYRALMDAIAKKAEEQGIWVETTDPVVAKDILNRVDLSDIIPMVTPTGRKRRLQQVRWNTLVNDFYAKRKQSQEVQFQPVDGGGGGGEDDDDYDLLFFLILTKESFDILRQGSPGILDE